MNRTGSDLVGPQPSASAGFQNRVGEFELVADGAQGVTASQGDITSQGERNAREIGRRPLGTGGRRTAPARRRQLHGLRRDQRLADAY
eukprot:13021211-Alexandrium_andersonii.AAC.1